jgi:ribulose bisphosphate carboxylase small subunit
MDDLTDKEVSDIIKETLEYGYVIPSSHAKDQMFKRGYSIADVRYILESGTIIKKELTNDQRCYTFKGNDLDGHPGEVVISLNAGGRKMVIITVKGGVK